MTVLPFGTGNCITGPLLSKKITYNIFLTVRCLLTVLGVRHFRLAQTRKLAAYKINLTENSKFDRIENIINRRENAVDRHFLLFPQCFLKVLYHGYDKTQNYVGELNRIHVYIEPKKTLPLCLSADIHKFENQD